MSHEPAPTSYAKLGGRLYHLFLYQSVRGFRHPVCAEEGFVKFSHLPEEQARAVYVFIQTEREKIRAPSIEDRPCYILDYRFLHSLGLISDEAYNAVVRSNEISIPDNRGGLFDAEIIVEWWRHREGSVYEEWKNIGRQIKRAEKRLPIAFQLNSMELTDRIKIAAIQTLSEEFKKEGEMRALLLPKIIKLAESKGIVLSKRKGGVAWITEMRAIAACQILSSTLGLTKPRTKEILSRSIVRLAAKYFDRNY